MSENFSSIAFLAFPNQLDFLLSELYERFSISKTEIEILGDIVLFHPQTYAIKVANEILREQNLEVANEISHEQNLASSNEILREQNFAIANKICREQNLEVANEITNVFQNALPYWAKLVLFDPLFVKFTSISEAANALKKMQRSWASYSFQFFRRTNFIQEKLPHINTKPKSFPFEIKTSPMGFFSLVAEHTMLVAKKTSSIFPLGEIRFEENHFAPPSRAYLKLQEALVQMNVFFHCDFPKPGEKVFDAGSSPGGWSWVFLSRDCEVFAVDRSPLTEELMKNPHLHFEKGDAFSAQFKNHFNCDWLTSDVICYPARLYDWLSSAISAHAKKIIATIKMQGAIDWKLVEKFSALPHSQVVHLNYNKHELTFLHFEK